MFAKVYQYKFPGVSEAKVAASYCSDKLGKKIVEFDFEGLNIMIGKAVSYTHLTLPTTPYV